MGITPGAEEAAAVVVAGAAPPASRRERKPATETPITGVGPATETAASETAGWSRPLTRPGALSAVADPPAGDERAGADHLKLDQTPPDRLVVSAGALGGSRHQRLHRRLARHLIQQR